MPFVCGCGGRSRGRSGGYFDLAEVSPWVKSRPMRAQQLAMGLRSLQMKRPLVVKPVEDGRGRTLVGLSEREVPAQSDSHTVP